ncbi:MAG TPA: hypothetical protein VF647_13945 [Longimicrobium sp.]|jgi:hypothetical protein
MHSSSNDAPQTTGTPDTENPSAKLAWHTPVVEEVPFTRTEAGGAGTVYDFTVYAGSV